MVEKFSNLFTVFFLLSCMANLFQAVLPTMTIGNLTIVNFEVNKCRVGNTGSAPRFVRRGSTLIDWVLPIFLWDRAALEFDELSYIKAEKSLSNSSTFTSNWIKFRFFLHWLAWLDYIIWSSTHRLPTEIFSVANLLGNGIVCIYF